ncbi:nitrate- and nitrite sensing domain-containing protein [Spirillospora sp. NPDC127200]
MTGRARSVKSKMFLLLVPPIAALVALWVFAAATTLTDTLRQTRAQTFTVKVAQPTDAVIAALQDERRMSLSHLGDDATIGRAGFDAQRTKTDRARDAFRRSAADGGIRGATREETRERMGRLSDALGELATLRSAVDQRKLDRAQALTRFTALIDLAADIYDDVPSDDRRVVRDTRLLISLERAREHLSREDALVTGALAAGRMTEEERFQLIELAGARRFLYDDAARSLSRDDFARYGAIVAGPESKRFQALEGRLTRWPATGGRPPVDIGAWHTATEALGWQLAGLSTGIRATTAQRAEDAAGTFLTRLALTGGLGLLAVLAAIVVAVRVSRRLIRESRTMADTVTVFARDRLPAISEAARRGEPIADLEPPAGSAASGAEPGSGAAPGPAPGFTVTEISRIDEAFAEARRAVICASTREAAAHRRLNDVVVTLARRNQSLLQRLLSMLETMQRRADRADELEALFALDHLATRMRRHAEGLVVLSGRAAGRTWRNPVRLMDVARAAAAEIEDYTRVEVLPMGPAALHGPAVADTIHLLAELVENAAAFSPPTTLIRVTGGPVGRGFAIEIEDRGLGMSSETLAECNQRLATAADPDLTDTSRLGLFVVARLAARHGVSVTLRPSPYGGVTAIVLLPQDLVVDPPQSRLVPAGELATGENLLEPPTGPHSVATTTGPHAVAATGPHPVTATTGPQPAAATGPRPVAAPAEPEPPLAPTEATGPIPLGAPVGPFADTGEHPRPAPGAAPLPTRRRQASLAPQLRDRSAWADRSDDDSATTRSPEDAARLIGTMQRGWQRGRAAAERDEPDLPGGEAPPSAPPGGE